jgi:hypothetical protein
VPELLVKHLLEEPPPIRSLRADVPQHVAMAIDRCLAKNREDRFESAEEFAAALAGDTDATRTPMERRSSPWAARLEAVRQQRSDDSGSAHARPQPADAAASPSAVDVFQTLSAEQRTQLGEVRGAVRALEDTIHQLREREAVLEQTLAEAGGIAGEAERARLDELKSDPEKRREAAIIERRMVAVAQIAAERVKVQNRISAAHAALESIRVDLLRLRSGVGTVDEIAPAIGTASEVCRDAEVLLSGSTDIRRRTTSIEDEIYRL